MTRHEKIHDKWHGMAWKCNDMAWKGMEMAWQGMAMAWKLHGTTLACHGMTMARQWIVYSLQQIPVISSIFSSTSCFKSALFIGRALFME
jgi:hypothetical protein